MIDDLSKIVWHWGPPYLARMVVSRLKQCDIPRGFLHHGVKSRAGYYTGVINRAAYYTGVISRAAF